MWDYGRIRNYSYRSWQAESTTSHQLLKWSSVSGQKIAYTTVIRRVGTVFMLYCVHWYYLENTKCLREPHCSAQGYNGKCAVIQTTHLVLRLQTSQSSTTNKLKRQNMCLCSLCALGCNACLMWRGILFSATWGQSYIDLVVAKALLHLIEETAIRQLTEGCQIIVRSRRHQFNLRKIQGEGQNEHADTNTWNFNMIHFKTRTMFSRYWYTKGFSSNQTTRQFISSISPPPI